MLIKMCLTQKLHSSESKQSCLQHLHDFVPGNSFQMVNIVVLSSLPQLSSLILVQILIPTNDLRIFASLEIHILSVAVVLESVFGENTTLVRKGSQ